MSSYKISEVRADREHLSSEPGLWETGFRFLEEDGWPGHPDILLIQAVYQITDLTAGDFSRFHITPPANLNKMVAKRRSEYLAARLCARKALLESGSARYDVPGLPDRSPAWPDGYTGSLTHTSSLAAACVARSDQVSHIGLDIEDLIDPEMYQDLQGEILTPDDRPFSEQAQALGLSEIAFLTLIFSAKEAVFKAIYRDVGYIFGFEAVSLVAFSEQGLTFVLNQDLSALWPEGREIDVQYQWKDNRVCTLIMIGLSV